jgi:hypothetical protein
MQWQRVGVIKVIAWQFAMIVAVVAFRPGLQRLFAQLPAMLRKARTRLVIA